MSDTIKVEGRVKLVEETKTYGAKGFKKRLMVIETDAKYNNEIAVEATQDKCEMFDGVMPGDHVTAFVNIEGRAWKERYFVSLSCWKIENQDESRSGVPNSAQDGQAAPNAASGMPDGELDDGIPF